VLLPYVHNYTSFSERTELSHASKIQMNVHRCLEVKIFYHVAGIYMYLYTTVVAVASSPTTVAYLQGVIWGSNPPHETKLCTQCRQRRKTRWECAIVNKYWVAPSSLNERSIMSNTSNRICYSGSKVVVATIVGSIVSTYLCLKMS